MESGKIEHESRREREKKKKSLRGNARKKTTRFESCQHRFL